MSGSDRSLLLVDGLTVSYEGYKALDDVTFGVETGAVHVLIGPNGAGKSTLLDAIIGRVRPTSGRIMFKGEDISALPEHEIVRRGICRKFQTPGVLEALSVGENLAVAATHNRGALRALGTFTLNGSRARVDEVLETIGLAPKRDYLAAHLSHGEKQWLEIGMVVASNSDLLLLDEPAAGMTHREAELTAQLIRSLAGRHAFVVIDHDMDFVGYLAAPVSVLHMGRFLAHGTIEEVRRNPQVAAVYLGRENVA
ncbi:MAG TPA: urea ABC transporter ATP-binding protein UrtD [Candidatus Baltobacteraceae bacterium]|jgi:urea transport system ATP-binding protein